MPDRRRLSAAEGVQAARILFALNTETSAILRMLRQCGFPPALLQDGHAAVLCTEWRAFVHAAVTAALMQHAPVEVVLAYLRQTHQLLGDAAPAALRAEATGMERSPSHSCAAKGGCLPRVHGALPKSRSRLEA